MARIRAIKPDIPQDVKLSGVSDGAERTFYRLISQSDDEGLQPGSARQLLGALYPHRLSVTERDIDGWLAELEAIGTVAIRLTTDGVRVVQLVNWHRHQVIKHKTASRLLPRLAELVEKNPTSSAISRGNSALEVGSRKKEVGDTSSEEGGEAAGACEAAPAAAPVVLVSAIGDGLADSFARPDHRAAYLGYRRTHRMPDALDAVLAAAHAGNTGSHPPRDWPVLGAALLAMRAVQAEFSQNALHGFARRVGETPPPDRAPGEAGGGGGVVERLRQRDAERAQWQGEIDTEMAAETARRLGVARGA